MTARHGYAEKRHERTRRDKYASKGSTADSIALVRAHAEKHAGHHVGIAHTRWATHGGKTDETPTPTSTRRKGSESVHNGVIMNADALREQLQSEGDCL